MGNTHGLPMHRFYRIPRSTQRLRSVKMDPRHFTAVAALRQEHILYCRVVTLC